MAKLNSEMRELRIEDLDYVAGGMPFYGMGCSANQSKAIGGIVDRLGSVPIFGGILAGIANGTLKGVGQ